MIHYVSPNLSNYQQEVWNLISQFHAFNIIFVPRIRNVVVRLSPLRNGFSVEIIYRPSIPDNITNFFIFNDKTKILDFMANTDVFKDANIGKDEKRKYLHDLAQESKGNLVTKGVVSLEKLYNLKNHFKQRLIDPLCRANT